MVTGLSLDHHLSSAPLWGWWDAQSCDSPEQSRDSHVTLTPDTNSWVTRGSRDYHLTITSALLPSGGGETHSHVTLMSSHVTVTLPSHRILIPGSCEGHVTET